MISLLRNYCALIYGLGGRCALTEIKQKFHLKLYPSHLIIYLTLLKITSTSAAKQSLPLAVCQTGASCNLTVSISNTSLNKFWSDHRPEKWLPRWPRGDLNHCVKWEQIFCFMTLFDMYCNLLIYLRRHLSVQCFWGPWGLLSWERILSRTMGQLDPGADVLSALH